MEIKPSYEEQQLNTSNEKSKRNSLLELYRFLCAMWVVYYHGFFIFKNNFFSHGYIAVEFFFILSGFFLIKGINRHIEKPFFKGLISFLWKRIKALGLPFIIGVIFAVWFMFIEGEITTLGYLWYIPFMLLAFVVVFILKKLIKNEKIFISIIFLITAVSYVLLYVPILKGWGLFRGLGGVCLGVLISYIPKLNLKVKFFNFNWLITFVLFCASVCLACLPKPNLISEYFLVLLLLPMLIYFTNNLNVNCKFLNFLGSLSFGLYAYQCVIRVIEHYAPIAQYWLFAILIGLVLIDKLIICLFKYFKNKSKKQPLSQN